MTRRVPATVLIGAIAVSAIGVTSAVMAWRASSASNHRCTGLARLRYPLKYASTENVDLRLAVAAMR
jgi:hypothetical protein